jgi:oligopeptide/dipeptide ABC transporter ATP-binding protein
VDHSPSSALNVRGLSVTFGTRRGPVPAVVDVDLDVAPGELVALLGESGSGKSVTARAVMGLSTRNATVTAESIRLGDTDLLALPESEHRKLRGARMSLVFQDALSALNPVLSIGDQIGELFRTHRDMSRRQARAEAIDLLGQVGIPAPARRAGDYPHQFSGGMRQRILIAMAIALRPELIIADEPTTALDVTVQAQILDLIRDLQKEFGSAVIMITHDLGVVAEVADDLLVMYAGRVVERGTSERVFTQPQHPYTWGLLGSMPRLDRERTDRLNPVKGSPPSLINVPSGCAFHPRCPYASLTGGSSETVLPELREMAPGHVAACHLA